MVKYVCCVERSVVVFVIVMTISAETLSLTWVHVHHQLDRTLFDSALIDLVDFVQASRW